MDIKYQNDYTVSVSPFSQMELWVKLLNTDFEKVAGIMPFLIIILLICWILNIFEGMCINYWSMLIIGMAHILFCLLRLYYVCNSE